LIYFKNKNNLYSPFKHIDCLYQLGNINLEKKEQYLNKVKRLVKQVDVFIKPDGEKILKKLRKHGHYLVLLTFGDLYWQKQKVKNLRLSKNFEKILITDKSKVGALKFLRNKQSEVIIINDNAQENLLIRRSMPLVKTILISGPHAVNIIHNEKKYKLNDIFI